MAADLDTLNFLAPGLAGVSDSDKTKALELAVAYRPPCLTEEMQDQAQVYYAIWLLYNRVAQTAGEDSGIGTQPAGVKSIKEGDVTVTWASEAETGGVTDPSGFYARWAALDALCGHGAITVGRPRHGHCC